MIDLKAARAGQKTTEAKDKFATPAKKQRQGDPAASQSLG